MTNNDQFVQSLNRVRAFLQKDVKTIVKVETVKHFKQSFQDEGFTDQTLKKWPDISDKAKARKRRRNGSLTGILTDTGDLGNSIHGTIEGSDVVVGSDLPYAQRHNQGLHGMKKRQFLGRSRLLESKITAQLNKGIGRLLGNVFR